VNDELILEDATILEHKETVSLPPLMCLSPKLCKTHIGGHLPVETLRQAMTETEMGLRSLEEALQEKGLWST
jgi:hypothetical protein